MPLVSVIMSVYNGAQYLKTTIESVLNSRGVELEFIIINDGSTDNSSKIIREFEEIHSQIKLIDQENTGLTMALISGCQKAQGKFIARIDAGDLCNPDRFLIQVDSLNNNPDIVLLGSYVNFIDINDHIFPSPYPNPPLSDKALKKKLELENTFAHSSVMFRKDAYSRVGGYRSFFQFAQDYDLWWRISEIGTIGICPLVLSTLRYSNESISINNRPAQIHYTALSSTIFYAKRKYSNNIEVNSKINELISTNDTSLNNILTFHYKAISNMLFLTDGNDLRDNRCDIMRQSLLIRDIRTIIKFWIYALFGKKLYKLLKFIIKIHLNDPFHESQHVS